MLDYLPAKHAAPVMAERRVVVTGMGITSCLGNSLDEVAKSLHECKSGIKFNEDFKAAGMKSHVCGKPDLDMPSLIDRKQIRFMGDNCQYAYLAMEQALERTLPPSSSVQSPQYLLL